MKAIKENWKLVLIGAYLVFTTSITNGLKTERRK